MISRIAGRLIQANDGRALLECEHLVYEVLVPGCDIPALNRVERSSCSIPSYHESMVRDPRSFPTHRIRDQRDRAFFELFTTVKNIGNRKALRQPTAL